MACVSCKAEEYFAGYCRDCYRKAMLRRISHGLRTAPIRKGERLCIADALCKEVLQDILGGLPVTISAEQPSDREVLSWTADDEIDAFCNALFNGQPLPRLGHTAGTIKLFLPLTDLETEKLATLFVLPWQPKQKSSTTLQVEALAKKYPELKAALQKSLEELRVVLSEAGGSAQNI